MSSNSVSESAANVEIYRPFFLAGILTVLTAGCTLGAVALVGICLRGSYVATGWTPYVLAHANSQLYGWVGFFVMGFALQMHPPRQSKLKLFQTLAVLSLSLMAVGLALRFVADPLATQNPGTWTAVGVLSASLQAVAVAIFLVNNTITRQPTGEALTWQTKFIFASLIWFALIAVAEPFAFANSHQAPMDSIMFVAQWFNPLREAQFLGFVANMIFGIALVKLHTCFGAKPAYRWMGNTAFVAWNLGILLRMSGWVLYYRSGMEETSAHLYTFSGSVLACGALFFVFASRIFDPLEFSVSSHKFIKAAFVWLIVGGVLMMCEPLDLRALSVPFSHAYIGGIRHALTVGFISQMIIGVGSHVIARMNNVPDRLQKGFMATFILLNVGNAGRVFLEIASDYTPRAFQFMSVTGFVELTGMAIWGISMAGLMIRSRRHALAAA
ncbi:MAG: NnrS family protein [Fimbriimonas sp.]|nr:NnrS family protein [Fimbriimonas sp.]